MNDETSVGISSRKLKSGKKSYHLRWIDTAKGKWVSKAVGSDKRLAMHEAEKLRGQLRDGTYTEIRSVTWADFVREHLDNISGSADRVQAKMAMKDFGAFHGGIKPKNVNYSTIEGYVAWLKKQTREGGEPKYSTASINKKLRYLRAAFNKAIRRRYMKVSPMQGWRFEKEDKKAVRFASDNEITAILKAAGEVEGIQVQSFIRAALDTGARRNELIRLTWDRVDFDDASVLFTKTKGKKDRRVYLKPDTVSMFTRLQAMTLQDGGPFVSLGRCIDTKWAAVLKAAGVSRLTIHDLRRTFVRRLVRAGVPLPDVQALAGHENISTTLKYYNAVTDSDLRASIEKMVSIG